MQYVTKEDKQAVCVFCHKSGEQRDEQNLVLHRGRTCFIMLNTFPYNNGHLMVAPYRHQGNLAELTSQEAAELMSEVQLALRALCKSLRPNGFNVGCNLGACAGAGIADHLHMHIVPRWEADTNYMTVLSETRVIPEGLTDTYRKLLQALEELG